VNNACHRPLNQAVSKNSLVQGFLLANYLNIIFDLSSVSGKINE